MSNEIEPELIGMIRCPITKSELRVASNTLISRLNQRIEAGDLVNRVGTTVSESLEGGLVNESNDLFLPIRGGILVLVADQAIPVSQDDLAERL